jgi:predicted unusual protein kinase regulating ubiquinone biosynthesis (AarF/ABC1/UbiB family)
MNNSRYRKIVWFFGRMILGLLFWEVFLRRIGFKKYVRRSRSKRLKKIAVGYRELAVAMGGVLIKVGQFLSARADILPVEITMELSGLQDEVPPEDFSAIRQLAERELGAELNQRFASFEEIPLAAASLGQVHRAKMKADGEEPEFGVNVVVKIQRPNIEQVIAIDLAALGTVGRWVMRYKPISRRADVPSLLAEFAKTLYEEIDYLAEGHNAEIFAENIRDVPGVRVPAVVWTHTTRKVLVLEDVFSIKVIDYGAIEAAGIDRTEVARRLFDVYLKQIFEDSFFHADPHPGNLFVEPDPDGVDNGGWKLTFVDFGMVGHVLPNARAGLRELAIGLGTKDPQRMLKAYKLLNVLLPHADLDLLARADAKMFEQFWGKSMEELKAISFEEMHEFAKEFRELVFSMPFQVPQDLIFLIKTVAILAGICTGLDASFNFWQSLAYAQQLLAEEGGSNWDFWLGELGSFAQTLIALPGQMDHVLGQVAADGLLVRAPSLNSQVRRIDVGVRMLVSAVLFMAFLTNGVWLFLEEQVFFAWLLFAGAFLTLFIVVFGRFRRR